MNVFRREPRGFALFQTENNMFCPDHPHQTQKKGRTEAAPPDHANVTGVKQFRFPMTIKRRPKRRAER